MASNSSDGVALATESIVCVDGTKVEVRGIGGGAVHIAVHPGMPGQPWARLSMGDADFLRALIERAQARGGRDAG